MNILLQPILHYLRTSIKLYPHDPPYQQDIHQNQEIAVAEPWLIAAFRVVDQAVGIGVGDLFGEVEIVFFVVVVVHNEFVLLLSESTICSPRVDDFLGCFEPCQQQHRQEVECVCRW